MIRPLRFLLGLLTLALGIALFGAYAALSIREAQASGNAPPEGVSRAAAMATRVLFEPWASRWHIHILYYVAAAAGILGALMTRTLGVFAALVGAAFLAGYGAAAGGAAAGAENAASVLRAVGTGGGSAHLLVMGLTALLFGMVLTRLRTQGTTC